MRMHADPQVGKGANLDRNIVLKRASALLRVRSKCLRLCVQKAAHGQVLAPPFQAGIAEVFILRSVVLQTRATLGFVTQ